MSQRRRCWSFSFVLLSRAGEGRLRDLHEFCVRGSVETVPFGPEHVALAFDAFRRFGKGRHPAGLNFGDCFSYALAKATGEPLLFKGDDFTRTDVTAAVWGAPSPSPARAGEGRGRRLRRSSAGL